MIDEENMNGVNVRVGGLVDQGLCGFKVHFPKGGRVPCVYKIPFFFSFLQFMLGSTRSIWHSRACEI